MRKAKTDAEPLPRRSPASPAGPRPTTSWAFFAALSDITREDVLRDFGGAQFSSFKGALVDLAVERLGPIGGEMKRLVADEAHIDAVLADGAARAEAIARPTVEAVKEIVGFVRRR